MSEIESHTETIKCPECKAIQTARVLDTIPWPIRVHDCICGYTIMKSEWTLYLPTESQSDKKQDNPSESA